MPLGEAAESYRVRVVVGGTAVRETLVGVPAWTYGAAEQAADGAGPGTRIEVAQMSQVFGPGPAASYVIV